jgi:hypothetical protein
MALPTGWAIFPTRKRAILRRSAPEVGPFWGVLRPAGVNPWPNPGTRVAWP